MPQLHDLTHTILLTPTCGNCGHKLDRVYIKKLPVLSNEGVFMAKIEYAIEPDQCPNCKTYFDSIRTKNIIEEDLL